MGEGSAVDESGSSGAGVSGLSGKRRFSSYVDHGHGSSDESFVAAANAYAGRYIDAATHPIETSCQP